MVFSAAFSSREVAEEDEVVFFGAAFFTVTLVAADFLADVFFAAGFLAAAFFLGVVIS